MSALGRLLRLLRPPPHLEVWYDEAYRMPLPSLEAAAGIEPRRVDFVLWFLLDRGVLQRDQVRTPPLITFEDLQRVHPPEYLEALHQPATLARIFGVDPSEIAVDPLLRSVRLGAGGTLEAARSSLARRGPSLNLHGGFHHARVAGGAGFCAVNDIAVAVQALRADGFDGQVVVLDFDAHPPDGTAECLRGDEKCWIGSLSGSRWDGLEGVDEQVLPDRADDATYLAALEALLNRMPAPDLAFVVAGCDVLAGDRFGRLGLTKRGARRRDVLVAKALAGVGAVWLPGGGYHPDAWRVLAGTALVLTGHPHRGIRKSYDPLMSRFVRVSGQLEPTDLHGDLELTFADLEQELFGRPPSNPRLLGFYTASGLEYALYRQGVLGHIQRLGYEKLRVDLDAGDVGQRMRLLGQSDGREHVLIEVVVERQQRGHDEVLFVNWLSLRNPRATFTPSRPQLPGQEVPGLGMGPEATALLGLMARRLGLSAVVFRPAWYHLAYVGRARYRFVDPERQGRFEALVRDLGKLPLLEATRALAEGRVRMNDEPYRWEASDMMYRLEPEEPTDEWNERCEHERERVRFTWW
ncbi:MAG: histone deacetylase [Myxococcaceae bacterium]